jgi:hypothetical protein
VEQLPGYDRIEANVDWLSENPGRLTLQPGRKASFTVTLNAHDITSAGDRTASLILRSDSPYWLPAIPVSLHVVKPHGS